MLRGGGGTAGALGRSGGYTQADDREVLTVAKVQVGLLGSARELQRDLERIADRADSASSQGLHYILQGALLRCCCAAARLGWSTPPGRLIHGLLATACPLPSLLPTPRRHGPACHGLSPPPPVLPPRLPPPPPPPPPSPAALQRRCWR